jgi:glycosyltransferase involved in cell wall biosynthesis
MKNIIFVSDFFYEEIPGGAEAATHNLSEMLFSDQPNVFKVKIKSEHINAVFVENHKDCFFIVSNFVLLSPEAMTAIKNCDYVIYEHDHKYLRTRDPSPFKDYLAPSTILCNVDFYKKAKAVVCQSQKHADILKSNLLLGNVINAGCSLWKPEELDYLQELLDNQSKTKKTGIMKSDNWVKGTQKAVDYCQVKKIEHELIPPMKYKDFMTELSSFERVVFFSQVFETFCRFVVEARVLNCEIVTNDSNGCTSEKWVVENKGQELLNEIKSRQSVVVKMFEDVVLGDYQKHLEPLNAPKVSILTSVYKGDEYIEHFMEDITSQTYFDNCELVLINCNSPGNEDSVIEKYMNKYPDNIKYVKLDEDPGVYGAWNKAIEMSTGEYVTNANLDDRRSTFHIEQSVKHLINNNDVDLIYGPTLMTEAKNETFENNSSNGSIYPVFEFSPENMVKCLPGCMPVWRKSMHDKSGLFDENLKYAGDWDMWLRAVKDGSKFLKIDEILGLYYLNPEGLSTNSEKENERFKEEKEIFWSNKETFGQLNFNQFKEYFSREV